MLLLPAEHEELVAEARVQLLGMLQLRGAAGEGRGQEGEEGGLGPLTQGFPHHVL